MWVINTHTLGTNIIWILTLFNFIAIIIIAIRWKWVELMRKEIWPSYELLIKDIENKSWINVNLKSNAQISSAYRAHLDKFHRKFKKDKHGYPTEIRDKDYEKWAL